MELKKHKLGLKEDGDDWFSSEEQKKDDAALESEAAALPKKRGKRKGKLDLDAETIKTSDKAIKAAGGPRDKGKHSRLRASSAPRAQLLGPAKVGDDTTVGPFLAALVVILTARSSAAARQRVEEEASPPAHGGRAGRGEGRAGAYSSREG